MVWIQCISVRFWCLIGTKVICNQFQKTDPLKRYIACGNFKQKHIALFKRELTYLHSIRKGYWISYRLSHIVIGNAVVCIDRGEKRRIILCFEVCVAGCYRNMLLLASFLKLVNTLETLLAMNREIEWILSFRGNRKNGVLKPKSVYGDQCG